LVEEEGAVDWAEVAAGETVTVKPGSLVGQEEDMVFHVLKQE
jgi:hypothetical protein